MMWLYGERLINQSFLTKQKGSGTMPEPSFLPYRALKARLYMIEVRLIFCPRVTEDEDKDAGGEYGGEDEPSKVEYGINDHNHRNQHRNDAHNES